MIFLIGEEKSSDCWWQIWQLHQTVTNNIMISLSSPLELWSTSQFI